MSKQMSEAAFRNAQALPTKDLELLIYALIKMRDSYRHWEVKVVDIPSINRLIGELNNRQMIGLENRIRGRGICGFTSFVTEKQSSTGEARPLETRLGVGQM